MKQTRIALVQMNSIFGQSTHNLEKIKNFVIQAAKQHVDIICFPELAISAYSRDSAHLETESIPSPHSDILEKLSTRYAMAILAGTAENATDSNIPYITHLVALPGKAVQKYRKTHLGSSEKPYFSAGNEICTFVLNDQTNFGIQICWDLHFPEISTIMSLDGAEIIFAPHASPSIAGDRKKMWLKYLTARAYDNAVYIAACNAIGNNGQGHCFSGGSMVIDPRGNLIAEDFKGEESMLIVDLLPHRINKIRYQKTDSMKNIFYLNCRRPELYEKLMHK